MEALPKFRGDAGKAQSGKVTNRTKERKGKNAKKSLRPRQSNREMLEGVAMPCGHGPRKRSAMRENRCEKHDDVVRWYRQVKPQDTVCRYSLSADCQDAPPALRIHERRATVLVSAPSSLHRTHALAPEFKKKCSGKKARLGSIRLR